MSNLFLRHGEVQNVKDIFYENLPGFYLSTKGKLQAQKKYEEYKSLNFDAYFCSPLTRALETFSIIFPNKKPIITDSIREHLYHSCDVGRQPKLLKKEFGFQQAIA